MAMTTDLTAVFFGGQMPNVTHPRWRTGRIPQGHCVSEK